MSKTLDWKLTIVISLVLIANPGLAAFADAENRPSFPWDPTFSSPGMSLDMVIEEIPSPPGMKGESAKFRFVATGFAQEDTLTLWRRMLTPKGIEFLKIPHQLTVGPQGEVTFLIRPDIKLEFALTGIARGEAADFALVSEATGARAHTKAYLAAIEATSPEGCRATVELTSGTARDFIVWLEGFRAGETLRVIHNASKQDQVQTVTATAKGTGSVELRFRRGTQGPVHVTASGEACEAAVDFGVGHLDHI